MGRLPIQILTVFGRHFRWMCVQTLVVQHNWRKFVSAILNATCKQQYTVVPTHFTQALSRFH